MENSFVSILNEELNDAVCVLPPVSMHDVANASTPVVAEQLLQLHRFAKKFTIPNVQDEESLSLATWTRFLETEQRISVKWHSDSTTAWIKGSPGLQRSIRLEIVRILRHFSLSLSSDCGFGKGEQYISSGGKTSTYDKWSNHQWTCTRACFEMFARAMYSNRSTRRLVWLRCTKRYPVDPHLLKTSKDYRFRYFKAHLERVTKFVPGNRFSTVYKNNDQRRPICIEPLGNLFVQKGIGKALKRALKTAGLDTQKGQLTHQLMILIDGVSTVDFKDASDSIMLAAVKFYFPPWFYSLISQARSPYVENDGVLYRLNKVSSMGNGFTWELMTVLLLAVGRALGEKETSVYGDDVIIKDEKALEFMDVAEKIGFVVNKDKSYVAHVFKESCGGFVHSNRSLVSYDIEYVHNELQARSVMNKLYIQKENPFFGWLWHKLIVLVDVNLRGPVPDADLRESNLDKYYWCDDLPVQTNSGTQWIARALCYDERDIFKVNSKQADVVDLQLGETPAELHTEYMLRLKNQMRVTRPIRQDAGTLQLVDVTYFIHRTRGYLMSARQYKKLRSDLTNHIKTVYETDTVSREQWQSYLVTTNKTTPRCSPFSKPERLRYGFAEARYMFVRLFDST